MKKILITGTILCLLSLAATHAHAKLSKEYVRWAGGEFEMPSEIKKATNVSELQPFLDSKREFVRMAAVRRLGEIKGQKAVSLLVERFAKETSPRGLYAVSLVKLEIIRTLGRVGGEEAKCALLGILKSYWERGPKVKDKRGFELDRDFAPVVPSLLNALYAWSHDKDVFQTAKEIALSEDVAKVYNHPKGIGENAWKTYLKGSMIRKGIVDEKDSARYLLNFVYDVTKKGLTSETLESAKKDAAEAIIEEHSEAALSSVLKELEEDLAKEFRNELSAKTGYLKMILGKRADKKKQADSKKQKERDVSGGAPKPAR